MHYTECCSPTCQVLYLVLLDIMSYIIHSAPLVTASNYPLFAKYLSVTLVESKQRGCLVGAVGVMLGVGCYGGVVGVI